jgi:serine protease Do
LAANPFATTPKSIQELRSMEKQVELAVKKVQSTVVGVVVGGGQGSGVIISRDGLVMTAGHVTGDAGRECRVILPDGKTLRAKSLGLDKGADSGLLQIVEPGEYPFAELGKSGELKTGTWCIAIGHPGGYQRGRSPVVRLGRLLSGGKSFLTTDCTIVGGDSGGPLFDMSGRVIGIHSRIGQSLTANMHVPVDVYTSAWESLARGDVISPPALGMRMPKTGGPMIGVVGSTDSKGFKVDTVSPGAPAEKAGIKAGDIITKFGGAAVTDLDSLVSQVGKRKPGDEVGVDFVRDGKPQKVILKVAAQP